MKMLAHSSKSPIASAEKSSRRFQYVLFVILLFLIYSPALFATFVYDDTWMIVRNPALRMFSFLSYFTDARTFCDVTTQMYRDSYRPLATLSFAVDYHAWHLWAAPYHMENIVLHGINGFLVGCILNRLLKNRNGALFGTLLFLVHPIQIESVVWVAQRSTLLCAMGFLGAFLLLIQPSWEKTSHYLTALILYLLSLLGKETGIVFIGILLVHDLFWLNPRNSAIRQKRLMIYAGIVVITALYLLLRYSVLGRWNQYGHTIKVWPNNLILLLLAYPIYWGKLILPLWLRPSYDYPLLTLPALLIGISMVCLSLWAIIFSWKRRPLVCFSCVWIIVTLLPVLHIIPIVAFVADRFLYLPSVGWSIGLGSLYCTYPSLHRYLTAWLMILAVLCVRLIPCWKTEQRLWEYTIHQEPTNAFAHICYAQTLSDRKLAEQEYKQALLNNPNDAVRFAATNNLSLLYRHMNQPQKAYVWAKMALATQPDNMQALYNYWKACDLTHHPEEARRAVQKLRQILPANAALRQTLPSF